MYSAVLLFGFAGDPIHARAGEFFRKAAIIGTMMNEWAPLLPYNSTFWLYQTAADEGDVGFWVATRC
jgi:hypothetical protein